MEKTSKITPQELEDKTRNYLVSYAQHLMKKMPQEQRDKLSEIDLKELFVVRAVKRAEFDDPYGFEHFAKLGTSPETNFDEKKKWILAVRLSDNDVGIKNSFATGMLWRLFADKQRLLTYPIGIAEDSLEAIDEELDRRYKRRIEGTETQSPKRTHIDETFRKQVETYLLECITKNLNCQENKVRPHLAVEFFRDSFWNEDFNEYEHNVTLRVRTKGLEEQNEEHAKMKTVIKDKISTLMHNICSHSKTEGMGSFGVRENFKITEITGESVIARRANIIMNAAYAATGLPNKIKGMSK